MRRRTAAARNNNNVPPKPPSKKPAPPEAKGPVAPSTGDQAAKVEQQAAALAAAPEKVDAAQLAQAAGELERLFRGIRQRAQQIQTGKEAQSALAQGVARAAVSAQPRRAALAADVPPPAAFAAPPPAGGGTGGQVGQPLGDFFQKVCRSVIDAQKQLDQDSLAYALDRKGSPTPGSLYSIPKVTAQIKAGFSTQDTQKLNIILFSKSDDSSTYGESTISFDVTAAPPPPGSLDRFQAPVPPFLLSGDAQEAILSIVQAQGVPAPFGDPAWRQRAAVFHISDSAPYPYLILIPQAPTSPPSPVPTLAVQLAASPVSVSANPVNRPELANLVSVIRSWLDSNDIQTTRPAHA